MAVCTNCRLHTIITAHKALTVCLYAKLNELKQTMDIKWGYLCYSAMWYDPVMQAINAFNSYVNQKVTGVTVKLKGKADVVAMQSPFGLAHVVHQYERVLV